MSSPITVADISSAPELKVVTLSLISHTNAGKTTLARTLLRRDVGEVQDAPHVTLFNESYPLLRVDGHLLRLWDTPGFGDSARLLRRLKRERNAVLWFLSQTWDRLMDRALWCSQQALKNVRDEADVVLYLVNASEPPEAATYLAAEMEILGWVNKPVLVLLNQTGKAGLGAEEAGQWEEFLAGFEPVKKVLALDAFARCWVQELHLMDAVAGLLSPAQQADFLLLKQGWHRRNLTVFDDAMRLLADLLTSAVLDGVEVRAESVWEKLGIGRAEINKEYQEARQALAVRLAERVERVTDALILLHGLDGKAGAADRVSSSLSRAFFKPEKVSESVWGVLGSFAGGAMGGLLADLKMGGLSLGGGALLGGLATGLTTYAVIRSYNLVRGSDDRLHWSREHFREQLRLAMLAYLAVAHFGRGRGSWEEGEQPEAWRDAVKEVVDGAGDRVDDLWRLGVERQAMPDAVVRASLRLVKDLMQQVLRRLYQFEGVV
jgi:GTP-binding protein EngB required for normal cell division